MSRNVPWAASAALCIAGCLIAAPAAAASGWFGNVYLGGDRAAFDAHKVFVVSFRVAAGSARVTDAIVAYGSPTKLPAGRRDYLVELVGADGHALSSRGVADPRVVGVERQGNVLLPDAPLSARVGFDRAGAKVRLRDSAGRTLAEADLTRALDTFCARNTKDPDCRARAEGRPPRS